MINKTERMTIIYKIAKHWHGAIEDFKAFNKYLKDNHGIQTQRRTVARLLGYI